MFYFILFFMSIFFHFSVFAQTNMEDLSQKNTVSHILLNMSVLPENTFSAYRPKNKIFNNVFEFYSDTNSQQPKFRVSLVGVNINTWLENPDNLEVLGYLAQQFPVENLLDNLAEYNPQLEFNTPDIVFKALHTDIYSPYLKVVANAKSLPRYFSSVSNTVFFTRKYNIYGAAAQQFPYFGQPVKGFGREINLGILPGQLEEYQAKLPDTDIFLVAMVNISPNWLAEGWDVVQVNRQQITVLIYAFDRKGKLIGGAGIPQSLSYNGRRFVMEQAVQSRVWQPLVSRRFYAWPSFKIVNTPVPNTEKKVASVVLSNQPMPKLNSLQRYVLKSVKNLQAAKKSIDIQLFDDYGKKIYKPYRLSKNTNKIFLKKQKIIHKNQNTARTQIQNELFSFLPYMLKSQNLGMNAPNSKKAKLPKNSSKKSAFLRSYYPSNEGDKLRSIVDDALGMMIQSPVSYTNALNITNDILPFEEEVDPLKYHKQRKKYYSLRASTKEFNKSYNKKTRQIIDLIKKKQKDRLFWADAYKKLLVENKLWTEDLEQKRKAWESAFLKKSDIEIQLAEMTRKQRLADLIPESLEGFSERQRKLLQSKYTNKEKKLSLKIAKINAKADKMKEKYYSAIDAEEYKNKYSLLRRQLSVIARETGQLFNEYIQQIPTDIDFSYEEEAADFSAQEMERLQKIIEENRIPEQAVLQIYKTKQSPMTKYLNKRTKKRAAKYKKDTSLLRYEGFMLGLSGSRRVKTALKKRMIRL